MLCIPMLKVVHRVLEERMESEDCTAVDRADRLSASNLSLSRSRSRKGRRRDFRSLEGLEAEAEAGAETNDHDT